MTTTSAPTTSDRRAEVFQLSGALADAIDGDDHAQARRLRARLRAAQRDLAAHGGRS